MAFLVKGEYLRRKWKHETSGDDFDEERLEFELKRSLLHCNHRVAFIRYQYQAIVSLH